MANNYQFDPSKLYTSDGMTYQNPFNSGAGNIWDDKKNWVSMMDGTKGFGGSGAGNFAEMYSDPAMQEQLRNMGGYLARGDDGEQYMVGTSYYKPPQDQESAATNNYDIMFGGLDGKGRSHGEMNHSLTRFRPDWGGDIGAYNGQGFDMFDKNGGYVGGSIPTTTGDKAWDRWQLTVLASMATAGLGAYMAPAATGASAGTAGATLGEGALAASGNFGLNAGTAGAAGANAAAAGAGGIGAAGSAGAVNPNVSGNDLSTFYGDYGSTGGTTAGSGSLDLGGGISMGADGSISGATGGSGGLTGTAPPANPYYGSGSTGGMFSSGGGSSGGMFGGSVNIPGIGSVATSDLMQYALPLLGALAGSEGQEQTTTSTKELPPWLQGPVYGNGGLIPQSQWLMNQQLTNPGMLNQGLLRTTNKKNEKKKSKRGLL